MTAIAKIVRMVIIKLEKDINVSKRIRLIFLILIIRILIFRIQNLQMRRSGSWLQPARACALPMQFSVRVLNNAKMAVMRTGDVYVLRRARTAVMKLGNAIR